MKQVLIYSIQPEHVLNFLKGRKTIEVRKRDLPQWAKDKLDRGEAVQGYGYCTKGGKRLAMFPKGYVLDYIKLNGAKVKLGKELNGLVIVKFEVSGTTRYVDCSGCTNTENGYECENDFMYLLSDDPILRKATCLEADEIEEYGNGADLYAHHLTDITPIKPMELGEFYKSNPFTGDVDVNNLEKYFTHWIALKSAQMLLDDEILTKAPQSFQSAWVKGE